MYQRDQRAHRRDKQQEKHQNRTCCCCCGGANGLLLFPRERLRPVTLEEEEEEEVAPGAVAPGAARLLLLPAPSPLSLLLELLGLLLPLTLRGTGGADTTGFRSGGGGERNGFGSSSLSKPSRFSSRLAVAMLRKTHELDAHAAGGGGVMMVPATGWGCLSRIFRSFSLAEVGGGDFSYSIGSWPIRGAGVVPGSFRIQGSHPTDTQPTHQRMPTTREAISPAHPAAVPLWAVRRLTIHASSTLASSSTSIT